MKALNHHIEVWFEDRRYWVHLETETVVAETRFARGKTSLRRVTSKRIISACVLRASDKVHGTVPGRGQA